jgi:ArsR family transcriptional regulator, arsenate/arsenite/antimonite-responsive transcriptional repressor
MMSTEDQQRAGDSTDEQVALFGALADSTRLRLIKLLRSQREPDALCVNALAGLLGVTQSAISQHLRVLKSIGLVKGERRGYRIHYFVNREALEKFQRLASAVLSMEEYHRNNRVTP